jgi:hypothetical protein
MQSGRYYLDFNALYEGARANDLDLARRLDFARNNVPWAKALMALSPEELKSEVTRYEAASKADGSNFDFDQRASATRQVLELVSTGLSEDETSFAESQGIVPVTDVVSALNEALTMEDLAGFSAEIQERVEVRAKISAQYGVVGPFLKPNERVRLKALLKESAAPGRRELAIKALAELPRDVNGLILSDLSQSGDEETANLVMAMRRDPIIAHDAIFANAVSDSTSLMLRNYDPLWARFISEDPIGFRAECNLTSCECEGIIDRIGPTKAAFNPACLLIPGIPCFSPETGSGEGCPVPDCKKVMEDCKEECTREFEDGTLPGIKGSLSSDHPSLWRACVRECMAEQGCLDF